MDLLTLKALDFLKSCNYDDRTHDERMGLIDLARNLYPDDEITDLKGIFGPVNADDVKVALTNAMFVFENFREELLDSRVAQLVECGKKAELWDTVD